MDDFFIDLVYFIQSLTWARFIRLFWFFVFFELTRYIAVDLIAILSHNLKRFINRKKNNEARRQLFFENPLVSIIIPGKNEGKHLHKLVTSLKAQTYQNYELIVVDDGSDDDTPIIGRSLEKQGLIDLFLRNEVRGGKASAANLALRFAKGKFLVHLDADCSFDFDAIEKSILPFYESDKVGAVGGNVLVRNYNKNLATRMQALEYYDTISIGRIVSSHLGIYRVISGAFGAFRMDLVKQIQGWDIGPGLDGDITVKIRKLGYKIKFADEAVCLTSVPDNFKKLAKQRLRWDKSLVRFRLRKHRDVFIPNKHFNWSNYISFLENITYSFIFNFKWIIYFLDVLIFNTGLAGFIFVINLILYSTTNYFKFLFFSLFRKRHNATVVEFLPFVPGLVIYFGFYLRIIRLVAHFSELFLKASYNDPWNPLKTSRHAKRLGL